MLGIYFWPLVVAMLARGVILAVGGAALTIVGLSTTQSAWFGIGCSLVLIGVSMVIGWILTFTSMRASIANRIGYSMAGLTLVVYWLLPFDFWQRVGVPKLSGGMEMFFVSGILLVIGGVWSVMFNADLIAAGLMRLFSHAGSLGPTMKMAVTYPMQNKFRTGLTLAMFSLVIFTLIVMSVLIQSSTSTLDLIRDSGGYQTYGNVSQPVSEADSAAVIAANPALHKSITAMGGIGKELAGFRQTGEADTSWHPYTANVLDSAYLNNTKFSLHARATGYGSDAQVWDTLRTKPGYAVIDGLLPEPASNGMGNSFGSGFTVKGIKYDDTTFMPRQIEMRDTRSGAVIPLVVIGVLDQNASNYLPELVSGVYTGANSFTALHISPIDPTTYVYRLAPGANVHSTALLLGKAFTREGLDVKEAQKQFDANQALNIGLNYLLEGFMALGLVVGIAALGVIAFRSVVERRQQIGMMRAIGFKRSMVRTAFLLESSFVAILGTLLGVVLGLVLAFNLVASIATSTNGITFSVPWLQITIIVVLAYIASLITTYLPAWQASRVYPAEALRYE
jgi:putative ABC transport system permease protein